MLGNRSWGHSSNAWKQESTGSQFLRRISITGDWVLILSRVVNCLGLGPLDSVRYLGWFTAMSNEVDESFKQMKEECDERLGKLS
jgi:hypothetical protein